MATQMGKIKSPEAQSPQTTKPPDSIPQTLIPDVAVMFSGNPFAQFKGLSKPTTQETSQIPKLYQYTADLDSNQDSLNESNFES